MAAEVRTSTVDTAFSGSNESTTSSLHRARRQLLAHPLTTSARRVCRNLLWSVKGLSIANPPLSEPIRSLTFVCLGNICRSPFASAYAAREANAHGLQLACQSAGIRPSRDGHVPAEACDVSTSYGVSLYAHTPLALSPELVESSDLIVVMEADQWVLLRSAHPQFRDRIFLLPLLDNQAEGAYERFNISDPFGQPRDAFEACYRRIERAVGALLEMIQDTRPTGWTGLSRHDFDGGVHQ